MTWDAINELMGRMSETGAPLDKTVEEVFLDAFRQSLRIGSFVNMAGRGCWKLGIVVGESTSRGKFRVCVFSVRKGTWTMPNLVKISDIHPLDLGDGPSAQIAARHAGYRLLDPNWCERKDVRRSRTQRRRSAIRSAQRVIATANHEVRYKGGAHVVRETFVQGHGS